MVPVSDELRMLGGVAPRRALLAAGVSQGRLTSAVRRGEIWRARQGWYILPEVPRSARFAVRVGGTLTSVSAAEQLGIWALQDGRLHVAVAPNAGRLRTPRSSRVRLADDNKGADEVCIHWRAPRGDRHRGISPVAEMLMDAVECRPAEEALAMVDSALNKKLVTLSALRAAADGRPARYAQVLRHSDGRCQSGLETFVRVRLQALGLSVRPQFYRRRVGHVDLLVGERLVIECDGGQHDDPDQRARDYDRDIELIAAGYIVLRLQYRHIVHEWPRICEIILGLVRDGRHRLPRAAR